MQINDNEPNPGKAGNGIAYPDAVTLDWKSGELANGLSCYGREEFFLTHEHWEIIWLQLQEPEKSFLQSLIQMTAAFHHLQTGNTAGAISLLRRSLRRLEHCPAVFAGILVESLYAEGCEWLRLLESKAILFPATSPQIRPAEQSAESTLGL